MLLLKEIFLLNASKIFRGSLLFSYVAIIIIIINFSVLSVKTRFLLS